MSRREPSVIGIDRDARGLSDSDWARFFAFRLILLVSVGGLFVSCADRREPMRNLFIVCIDTLRADHLGFHGYSRPTTPNLDSWASEAMVFDHALAPSSWTVPSVASMFTSRWPPHHGAGVTGSVRFLGEQSPPQPIAETIVALPEILQRQGFATGLFSANPFLYGSFQRGFDLAVVEKLDATALVDRTLDWIAKRPGERTFAYLHFMEPHEPNRAPERIVEMFRPEVQALQIDEHGRWLDPYRRQHDLRDPDFLSWRAGRLAAYDAAIRYVDEEIARLFEGLRRARLLDSSVVIITADHGEEFWDHAEIERAWADDPRGIWGVGHGHTLFQEQLHVPLVLSAPALPRGLRSSCAVSLVDVAPTSLALLGLPVPQEWSGSSLVPPAGESTPRCDEDRLLYSGSLAYGPESAAVLFRGLKLIRRGGLSPMLFDLASDPGETRDLAPRRSGVVSVLEKRLDAIESGSIQAPGPASELDRSLLRELEALGYIG